MESVERLLLKLISIPSFSNDEKEICNFIFELLSKKGFATKKIPVDKNGFNIAASIGEPNMYLCAHLDTISTPMNFFETPTEIFGRGACDTKGSAAAMITAGTNCKEKNLSNFGLLFTIGEETDFRGVKEILKSGYDIPFTIVGEPTSLEAVNGHYGILTLEVAAKGKSSHSSEPQKGINAIDILMEELALIKNVGIYSKSLMSIVKIEGGIADNIIPDLAKAVISLRISPDDVIDYEKKLQKILKRSLVKTLLKIDAIYCDIPKKLSFLKKQYTVKYCTELSFLKNGVVIGPGNIKYAHSNNERVSKKELKKAVALYGKIVSSFCKKQL